VIHFLKGAAANVPEGALTSNNQNWGVRSPGIGDTRDSVSNSRAGREDRHSYFPRVQARPGISRMDSGLLMSYVDNLNILIKTPVVYPHDMATGQRENAFNPCGLQDLGY
tara:strand:- start:69 stop:398 length:330 start_codon:yes stop_codon:yes gene_type:complete